MLTAVPGNMSNFICIHQMITKWLSFIEKAFVSNCVISVSELELIRCFIISSICGVLLVMEPRYVIPMRKLTQPFPKRRHPGALRRYKGACYCTLMVYVKLVTGLV